MTTQLRPPPTIGSMAVSGPLQLVHGAPTRESMEHRVERATIAPPRKRRHVSFQLVTRDVCSECKCVVTADDWLGCRLSTSEALCLACVLKRRGGK